MKNNRLFSFLLGVLVYLLVASFYVGLTEANFIKWALIPFSAAMGLSVFLYWGPLFSLVMGTNLKLPVIFTGFFVFLNSVIVAFSYIGQRGYLNGLFDLIVHASWFIFGLLILMLRPRQIQIFFSILLLGCLILFILLATSFDRQFVQLSTRATQIFAYEGRGAYVVQMATATLFPYLFIVVFLLGNKTVWQLLAALGLGFTLITMAYYSKRALAVDLTVTLFLMTVYLAARFFSRKQVKNLAVLVVVLLTGFIVVFAFDYNLFISLVDRVFVRFSDIYDWSYLKEFERMVELFFWWNSLTIFEKVIGGGYFHFFLSPAIGDFTNTLHIGLGTIYNSIGMVPFALWLIFASQNLFYLLRQKMRNAFFISLILFIQFLVTFTHSVPYGIHLSSFCLLIPLFIPFYVKIYQRSFKE